MALSNFTELKASVADWLNRDDLTDQIEDFIAIAESRHKREIRIREMRVREDFFVDTRIVPFPEGFLDFQYLRLKVFEATHGRKFYPNMDQLTVNQLTAISKADEDTDRPSSFCVHDAIEFNCEPDETYEGEILYYTSLPALSATQATNDLLDRAPDIYLWSTLSASAPFLLHDERIQTWEALYQSTKETLHQSNHDARHGGPLVSRVHGATP